ncbi:MAG TPA: transcriptional regulator GcvA [Steroidobacteraceae bacterium]|nr:transcriptional regulator GcvA [Steroidobacteraceae bacterium]
MTPRIPIGPLRAFDAAARHLNISAAARELNVTHAAVSKQIKQLELRLGVELFERLPRGLRLTPQGALLAEATDEAFARLARALTDLAAGTARRTLRIATLSSLAAQWLTPRLGSLTREHPNVDIEISTSGRLVDLQREPFDLAIRFGRGVYPNLHVVPLIQPHEIAVAAPELLARGPPLERPDDLASRTLLHDDSHAAWIYWLSRVGAQGVNARSGLVLGERNVVLQAARAGQGVALVSREFVRTDLETGRLVQLFGLSVPDEFAVYAVCLPQRLQDPLIAAVLAWFEREARDTESSAIRSVLGSR